MKNKLEKLKGLERDVMSLFNEDLTIEKRAAKLLGISIYLSIEITKLENEIYLKELKK